MNRISVQPFVVKDNLKDLGDFFRSSLGRNGNFKMFVSTVGQVIVSRISPRIVSFLIKNISDSCSEAILHIVKSHVEQNLEFGLTLGSLCCDLTLNPCGFLTINDLISKFKLKLDTSNVQHVMTFLKSTTKSRYEEKLCIKLLEGFLQSFPDCVTGIRYHALDIVVTSGGDKDAYIRYSFKYKINKNFY